MYTLTPETRHESECYLFHPVTFSTWEEARSAIKAFVAGHLLCFEDQVFFKVEKRNEPNYLWVGYQFTTTQTDKIEQNFAWYC